MKLSLIAVLLMLTVSGVVAPLANQEFRERATPPGWNVPEPRIREISAFALLTHPERNSTRAVEIRRVLINRSVLSVMPAMYVWLRWSALSHTRRRRYWPLPAWLMTAVVVVGFWATANAGSILEHNLWLPPGSALLVPLVAFAAWALVEQRFAQRSGNGQSVAAHEA